MGLPTYLQSIACLFEIAGIWKKAIACLAPSSPRVCGCSHKVSKFGLASGMEARAGRRDVPFSLGVCAERRETS